MAYGPTSIGGYMALFPATKEDIGGVKIGNGINIAEDGTISIDVSVDTVFPVGSIYLSRNNTSPAELFGGTWVKIASDRVLMGASSTHAAGTTVAAGLPNITGTGGFYEHLDVGDFKARLTGAFYVNVNDQTHTGNGASTDNDNPTLDFDASRSNPIYGRSNTVQPPAYYINIWERVADDS